jgi:outer membrane lipoprotein-sorting protein
MLNQCSMKKCPASLIRVAGACSAQALALLPLIFAGWIGGAFAQSGAPVAAPLPPVRAEALSQGEPPKLERINEYFNAMRGMQADFVQTAPDGRSFSGVLYLLRPGRMRFEYHPPAALEVVADGRSVAIRDRKLNTQDTYFIGQTPLKFLLQPKIDIAKDSKVTDLRREGANILLFLEDSSTLGGTSRIRVVFDGTSYALKEWTVTDPQGYDTRIMLSNIDLSANPSRDLFVIREQTTLDPK